MFVAGKRVRLEMQIEMRSPELNHERFILLLQSLGLDTLNLDYYLFMINGGIFVKVRFGRARYGNSPVRTVLFETGGHILLSMELDSILYHNQ
jgi:hypothetical protein